MMKKMTMMMMQTRQKMMLMMMVMRKMMMRKMMMRQKMMRKMMFPSPPIEIIIHVHDDDHLSRQLLETGVRRGRAWRLPECGRSNTRFVIFHCQTLTFKLSYFYFHIVEGHVCLSFPFKLLLSLSNFNFKSFTFTAWEAPHQVCHLSLSNFHIIVL